MTSEAPLSEGARRNATLAPRWHTAALVALIVAVAIVGSLLALVHPADAGRAAQRAPPGSRVFLQYFPVIFVNIGLVVYTTQLFRGGNALPRLLGRGSDTPRRALVDFALAAACFALICALEFAAQRSFPMGHNAAIAKLLPSTEAERLTWLVVAPCVGFCEEVVYRGYLRTQLAAFTRSRALGVLLQAGLFGLAHLERGPSFAARAAVYGFIFGVLAEARQSLWPGILCHASLDLLGGLVR